MDGNRGWEFTFVDGNLGLVVTLLSSHTLTEPGCLMSQTLLPGAPPIDAAATERDAQPTYYRPDKLVRTGR